MTRHEDHHHIFSFKRVILPLVLAFTFTLGALVFSYMAIYTLDVSKEERVKREFVSTVSSEIEDSPLTSEEFRDETIQEQSMKKQTPIREIPNYYSSNQTYWELNTEGEFINCHIHTKASGTQYTPKAKRNLNGRRNDKEQYMVHIHGLHHTGTGFLRQTIHQALNDEFAADENSPVVTIQDGTFPYKQGLSSIKKFLSPEDEGQHFQNVFPPFRFRQQMFAKANRSLVDHGKLAYLADECTFDNPQQESTHQLGNILLDEWSPFWNTSATFLIQKTPMLDVQFHESVKVIPTLHVIIVRHPMTSNAYGSTWMGLQWLDAFSHTFDLLTKNKIDWYAVVSYESLIKYRDEVVTDLLKVVRSGMRRFGSNLIGKEQQRRRRLHLHDSKVPLSYLVPKDIHIKTWETCLKNLECKSFLEDLTTSVLPSFGFINMDWADMGEIGEDQESELDDEEDVGEDDEDSLDESSDDGVIGEDEKLSHILSSTDDLWDVTIPDSSEDQAHSSTQLTSNPGLVAVSNEFNRVLFTSETKALGNKNTHDDIERLVTKMKDILVTHRKKYLGKQSNPKIETTKQMGAKKEIANIQEKEMNSRHWKLDATRAGISCEIDIGNATSQPTYAIPSNQFMVNVHGLHHTGTGFLRQTIQDSIDSVYPSSSSIQNYSLYPRIYSRSGTRKKRVPENEGQHLQTIFPPYSVRQKLKLGYDSGRYTYITDFCKPKDDSVEYNQIGLVLYSQWSHYWNTSATFLLQKTPTLDVHFLERTKVMPTLHVLVVRHPMASYFFGSKWMGLLWLDAWSHTLELLASGEIEWYAVITYESLVQYHDVIAEELMEVIRSGVSRYGGDEADIRRALAALSEATPELKSHHRQLELHAAKSGLAYLSPKSSSKALWKACNVYQSCHTFLKELSTQILPYFGYVDVTAGSGKNEDELTTEPGPKGVTEQFGHVLFSSEGKALRKFEKDRYSNGDDSLDPSEARIGDHPPIQLVSSMNELLTSNISPLKGRNSKRKTGMKDRK